MSPKPILDHPDPSKGKPGVRIKPDSGLQVRQDKEEEQRGYQEYTAQNGSLVFRLVCRKGWALNMAQSCNASALVYRWFVLISSGFRLFWNACRSFWRPSNMICPQCLVQSGSKATVTLVTQWPDTHMPATPKPLGVMVFSDDPLSVCSERFHETPWPDSCQPLRVRPLTNPSISSLMLAFLSSYV